MHAGSVSPDVLLPLLHATQQVDAATRRAAEEAVEQLKGLPGFASALCSVALDVQRVALELRQLAALLLKQFVRAHWSDDPDDDELEAAAVAATAAPRIVVCEAEKAAVRAALPSGLADRAARIRTAVSMTIAAIAQTDWPDAWPELMRELLERWLLARMSKLLG